ncbi:YciI family protein [Nonomuraea dietziae]|uniref:YciI family protein n=1 Tax=Nonomuraea dietziae TaxID=65515 RepID=UPI0034203315
MKYVMIIYGNKELWESIPAEQWQATAAAFDAFTAKHKESGELLGAFGVADAAQAKMVRTVTGVPVVTDGPYLESKEYLASWYLLDVDSEERALQLAAELPADQVEVWPILHEA